MASTGSGSMAKWAAATAPPTRTAAMYSPASEGAEAIDESVADDAVVTAAAVEEAVEETVADAEEAVEAAEENANE